MLKVTVGFVPRDRFCESAGCLRQLFECTQIPFELILVDCKTPEVYWEQIESVVQGQQHVRVIRTDQYLSLNQSRNLVMRENSSDFLCIIENDVWVHEGWLEALLAACDEYPADVAAPLILGACRE